MPIGKTDVLAALNDPTLQRLKFSIGQTMIGPDGFRDVHGAIANDRIAVVPSGSQNQDIAFYNMKTNAIEVPRKNPPLNLSDRAQLVHECVHAMNDLHMVNEVTLVEEAAAYLAQLSFMTLNMPPPIVPRPSPLDPRLGPLMRLMVACNDVAARYRLTEAAGFGASISAVDAFFLALRVRGVPAYARLGIYERSNDWPGVPGGGMEDLRRVLRGARHQGRGQGPAIF
ncbi:hypothetical protein EJV46_04180 [Roseococcus sp. SYP-B2431]|uniref:hypothetical protein n=1 Tax=Roseococcus sp. SYP-B2431 TaxID=2496640 RepID=UPI00103EAAB2|nr:hypothetical protein [Roseococcus sp. SYP-B2431]TCH99870.1 hypothetical protein EJV46_04180 [Roseococcus sp. SYP-B2431]